MRKKITNNCLVALLIVGSAISLLSCKERSVVSAPVSLETLMSEASDSVTVIVSENGRLSYRFMAPLMEGYSLAREPYREFRRGVKVITYLNDSLSNVDATLRGNYAIYYSNLKLWEVKGDVVIIKHDGKELYTQQLFWNSTTQRIYSNVDTKIVNGANGDVYNGEGFESDEQMKEWSFRKMTGRMTVDTTPTEGESTTSQQSESQSEQDAPAAQVPISPLAPQVDDSVPTPPAPPAAPPAKLDPPKQSQMEEDDEEGVERRISPQRAMPPQRAVTAESLRGDDEE